MWPLGGMPTIGARGRHLSRCDLQGDTRWLELNGLEPKMRSTRQERGTEVGKHGKHFLGLRVVREVACCVIPQVLWTRPDPASRKVAKSLVLANLDVVPVDPTL